MSTATLLAPISRRTALGRPNHLRAVARPETVTPTPAPIRPQNALPPGSAARGFALYVGIDEGKAAAAGVSLGVLVDALRRTLADLAPDAQTHATVALAPVAAGGRDVDVVRLALHEPSAVARNRPEQVADDTASEVLVDLSRKRVVIDGESANFTFKEFELLQYLVLREGRTIERAELVASLWASGAEDEAPGERTIDVHVRRLRAKMGRYEDIVRTVRGAGYRFDRRADVVIHFSNATPSPDRF